MNNNPQDKKPKIRLEMLSDWHIGTGAGVPGSTDALIARDGEGFPCVPAKSLVGIWRDALETLSRGLDNGTGEDWQKWVEVIFGSQPNQLKEDEIKNLANRNKLQPRPSIIKIRPARIDENLRQAIKGDKQLEQALTFIKPNTRIDADSGTAETESLRFTEMGRIGTVLEAEFELDLENFNSRQQELILTLLAASAGLVERIGGNRRRGSGKCAMSLDAKSLSEAVNCLRKNDLDLNAPDYKPEDKDFETNGATSDENDWRKIEFELKLHTPVAIVTATLGNVSETLDFIPGTYLLPHITKKLGKGISKHIAAGDFQVLPATIAITTEIRKKDDETFEEIKTRGLSVPKVIWYHKTDGGFDKEIEGGYDKKQEGKKPTVYNKIEESAKVEDLTYQKKNFREGYISSLDENGKQLPFYETTPKILLMHNTVKDDIQRPHEDVGGVFSREAIKAGTTLRGEIRFKKSLADEVKKLEKYTSYVRLGTSKKDDYGYTELTFETLSEIPSNPTVASELIVYLASDVLLRNDNLRQTNLVEDLKKELEKTLGTGKLKSLDNVLEELKAELEKNPDSEEIKEKIKKAKELLVSPIQVRRIESWHEGWGFPRPTFTAMSAGSVAVFEVAGTIKNDDLKNLELSGIGERRG
ncbi:MAG TPA: RAMP superfamily CRISPR-associated protein, partial [Pyrinomonadaceae bacterium]|nr:RAMP superfamily CRISPR-associated protein [Pyrinomonadaceae bacterium]